MAILVGKDTKLIVQGLTGSAPNSLMMSIVAMARPAPLTRQPISPSRAM